MSFRLLFGARTARKILGLLTQTIRCNYRGRSSWVCPSYCLENSQYAVCTRSVCQYLQMCTNRYRNITRLIVLNNCIILAVPAPSYVAIMTFVIGEDVITSSRSRHETYIILSLIIYRVIYRLFRALLVSKVAKC